MLDESPRRIRLDRQASSDIAKEGLDITRFIALQSVRAFGLIWF